MQTLSHSEVGSDPLFALQGLKKMLETPSLKTNELLPVDSEDFSVPVAFPSVGVLIVNMDFELIGFDRGSEAILKGLSGWDLNGLRLPAEMREMLGAWSPSEVASTKTQFGSGDVVYGCRAFLLEPLNGAISQAIFVLHLYRETPVSIAWSGVAEYYRLTVREREVVEGISLGHSSESLGERMNISPNTVKSHLRSTMAKMGVRTRAGIVSKLFVSLKPAAAACAV